MYVLDLQYAYLQYAYFLARLFKKRCQVISIYFGPKLLSSQAEMIERVSEFEGNMGCRGLLELLMGDIFPLKSLQKIRRNVSEQILLFYECFVTCDYCGPLMDVYCRWPGSVHDAKVCVFKN